MRLDKLKHAFHLSTSKTKKVPTKQKIVQDETNRFVLIRNQRRFILIDTLAKPTTLGVDWKGVYAYVDGDVEFVRDEKLDKNKVIADSHSLGNKSSLARFQQSVEELDALFLTRGINDLVVTYEQHIDAYRTSNSVVITHHKQLQPMKRHDKVNTINNTTIG